NSPSTSGSDLCALLLESILPLHPARHSEVLTKATTNRFTTDTDSDSQAHPKRAANCCVSCVLTGALSAEAETEGHSTAAEPLRGVSITADHWPTTTYR